MKTVIDAVNELKGDWGFSFNYLCSREPSSKSYIFTVNDAGLIDISKDKAEYIICTKSEFNDLVSQMETNFGNNYSYDYYKMKTNHKSDKELEVMDIDWSQAPEGATHLLERNEVREFARFIDGEFQEVDDERVTFIMSDDDYSAVSERPQPKPLSPIDFGAIPDEKPVFTQAMADNGELPSVGMECMIARVTLPGNENINVKVLFISESFIVYHDTIRNKELAAAIHLFKFKPLTPPIELIDGKAYQFRFAGDDVMYGIYNKDRNILSVEQGTYFDIARVYDIQPLPVEVK